MELSEDLLKNVIHNRFWINHFISSILNEMDCFLYSVPKEEYKKLQVIQFCKEELLEKFHEDGCLN
jgi:hypothetical protein